MNSQMYNFEEKIFKYQALIFDLDGTLIDSMPSHIKAWIQVGAEHGFEVLPETIYKMGGVSSYDVVKYYESLGHDVGNIDDFVKRKVELYRQNLPSIKAIEPIKDVLVEGHKRGLKIAIGTGTQRANAVDILALLKLDSYVDAIIGAEDVTKHKPDPETFLVCCQKLNVKPQDALVFEDSPLGIEAAHRGNMDCIEVKDCKSDFKILKA